MVIALCLWACYYQFRENGNITMQQIDHVYQTLYSELAQRSLDESFVAEFTTKGRFITQENRGRRYWYFDEDHDGQKKRLYVGPVDDPEISRRVETFKNLKADIKARRHIVSTLTREARLPRPDRTAGEIVGALETAGFFRLRGVLIGTVAFQCYSALLGIRLSNAAMQTADADFAQFHSTSAAVGDSLPPVLDLLREVDQSFREIPHQTDDRFTTKFSSRSGYKVEFLTPNTGSADNDGHPAPMPALGTTSAEPLRFLDFLIYKPVRAVVLHGAGVPVLVPDPARYAVHKLIVATRRRHDDDGTAKSRKDRLQASILSQALVELRQHTDLAEAYMEAFERGAHWRSAIKESLEQLDETAASNIQSGIAKGITRLGGDPTKYL
jgi:hypothetical protein